MKALCPSWADTEIVSGVGDGMEDGAERKVVISSIVNVAVIINISIIINFIIIINIIIIIDIMIIINIFIINIIIDRIIIIVKFICIQSAINKIVNAMGGLMTTEYVAEAFFR